MTERTESERRIWNEGYEAGVKARHGEIASAIASMLQQAVAVEAERICKEMGDKR